VIPFWLPEIIAIAAAGILVFGTDARLGLKLGIVVTLLLALFLHHVVGSPAAWAAGLVLEVAVAVFVLIWFRLPR
jgi:hypothetical protein